MRKIYPYKNNIDPVPRYGFAGFTVIELLIVIFIAAFALGGLISLYIFSLKVMTRNEVRFQALNLAGEALEIARVVRDDSWDNISNLNMGANYHPVKIGSPPQWSLSPGSENIEIFSRGLVFEDVNRDDNDDITDSGGLDDPGTKKVTSIVSWDSGSIELITYLTNWR